MTLPAGVFEAVKKDGTIYYRSSVTFHSKHISLGSFDTVEKAHEAYLDARYILENDTQLTPADYSASVCKRLHFKKWVTLTNFKNNHIYIKTPIYLKRNFFNYYLSKNDILTFDVDDLFYYSNHSIMRRGSHLFVSEYGMQTNIASRYGIRNFARPGTDFLFINGDTHDFRYTNIKILNPYQGVTLETKEETTARAAYTAKIHLNGNFIIGRFDFIENAAIAYNKAVDYAIKSGCNRQFEKNYIDDMSAAEYKKRYDEIIIPKKIKNYLKEQE